MAPPATKKARVAVVPSHRVLRTATALKRRAAERVEEDGLTIATLNVNMHLAEGAREATAMDIVTSVAAEGALGRESWLYLQETGAVQGSTLAGIDHATHAVFSKPPLRGSNGVNGIAIVAPRAHLPELMPTRSPNLVLAKGICGGYETYHLAFYFSGYDDRLATLAEAVEIAEAHKSACFVMAGDANCSEGELRAWLHAAGLSAHMHPIRQVGEQLTRERTDQASRIDFVVASERAVQALRCCTVRATRMPTTDHFLVTTVCKPPTPGPIPLGPLPADPPPTTPRLPTHIPEAAAARVRDGPWRTFWRRCDTLIKTGKWTLAKSPAELFAENFTKLLALPPKSKGSGRRKMPRVPRALPELQRERARLRARVADTTAAPAAREAAQVSLRANRSKIKRIINAALQREGGAQADRRSQAAAKQDFFLYSRLLLEQVMRRQRKTAPPCAVRLDRPTTADGWAIPKATYVSDLLACTPVNPATDPLPALPPNPPGPPPAAPKTGAKQSKKRTYDGPNLSDEQWRDAALLNEATTTEEVASMLLFRAGRHKAPGEDATQLDSLRQCVFGERRGDAAARWAAASPPPLLRAITALYNVLLLTSQPMGIGLRCGVITWIFKKGDSTIPTNYRGLTLLSHILKGLLIIATHRLTTYSTAYGYISPGQGGGRPEGNCEDLVRALLEAVERRAAAGLDTWVVFYDVAKAFDMVPRDRVMKRLASMGVHGVMFNFVARVLYHLLIHEGGAYLAPSRGLGQGNPLSPLLFVLVVDVVLEDFAGIEVPGGKGGSPALTIQALMFMDDLATPFASEGEARAGAERVGELLLELGLAANFGPDKTAAMHFPAKGQPAKTSLQKPLLVQGGRVPIVASYLYLGCYIENERDREVGEADRIKSHVQRCQPAINSALPLLANRSYAALPERILALHLFGTSVLTARAASLDCRSLRAMRPVDLAWEEMLRRAAGKLNPCAVSAVTLHREFRVLPPSIRIRGNLYGCIIKYMEVDKEWPVARMVRTVSDSPRSSLLHWAFSKLRKDHSDIVLGEGTVKARVRAIMAREFEKEYAEGIKEASSSCTDRRYVDGGFAATQGYLGLSSTLRNSYTVFRPQTWLSEWRLGAIDRLLALRKHIAEPGRWPSTKCVLCGRAPETRVHIFWCSAGAQLRKAYLQAQLASIAKRLPDGLSKRSKRKAQAFLLAGGAYQGVCLPRREWLTRGWIRAGCYIQEYMRLRLRKLAASAQAGFRAKGTSRAQAPKPQTERQKAQQAKMARAGTLKLVRQSHKNVSGSTRTLVQSAPMGMPGKRVLRPKAKAGYLRGRLAVQDREGGVFPNCQCGKKHAIWGSDWQPYCTMACLPPGVVKVPASDVLVKPRVPSAAQLKRDAQRAAAATATVAPDDEDDLMDVAMAMGVGEPEFVSPAEILRGDVAEQQRSDAKRKRTGDTASGRAKRR